MHSLLNGATLQSKSWLRHCIQLPWNVVLLISSPLVDDIIYLWEYISLHYWSTQTNMASMFFARQWCSYAQINFQVPQQRNAEECGNFVLYYINLFIESAPEIFSISEGYPYFVSSSVPLLLLCRFSEQWIIVIEWWCFSLVAMSYRWKRTGSLLKVWRTSAKDSTQLAREFFGPCRCSFVSSVLCGELEEIQRNDTNIFICGARSW